MIIILLYAWRLFRELMKPALLLFDALAFAFWIFGHDLPHEPTYLILIYIGALLIYSGYKVWLEEYTARQKITKQLQAIKDKTPHYSINYEKIVRYTINDEIKSVEAEIRSLEGSNRAKPSSVIQSALSNAFPSSVIFPKEPTDQKLARYNDYLAKLKKFAKRLENLYKIDFFLETSRYDESIEVWVNAPEEVQLRYGDDFISDDRPALARPTDRLIFDSVDPSVLKGLHVMPKSDFWQAGWARDQSGYSKLSSLNGGSKRRLFQQQLFIETELESITLEFKILSKYSQPQHIKKRVSLSTHVLEDISTQS